MLLLWRWPVAAAACALLFAAADVLWGMAEGDSGLARTILVLLYGAGCSTYAGYRRYTALQQRHYAQARVSPIPVKLRAATGWPDVNLRQAAGAGAIMGGLVAAVVPLALFLVFFFVTETWDWSVVAAVVAPAIGCGILFGAVAGLRWERQGAGELSRSTAGLPVDACNVAAGVLLYPVGSDEPFAKLDADAVDPFRAGDVFSGYLFGDLSIGGFAAITAEGLVTPARGRLESASTVENPYQIKDAPPSDTVAVAAVPYGSGTARYEIHADKILVTRTPHQGEPTTPYPIPLARVEKVHFHSVGTPGEGDDHDVLDVTCGDERLQFSPQEYGPDFPWILGQRLRQHGREDAVVDDRTRLHLGLVRKQHRPHQNNPDETDRELKPTDE
jgi:hypothetical protein